MAQFYKESDGSDLENCVDSDAEFGYTDSGSGRFRSGFEGEGDIERRNSDDGYEASGSDEAQIQRGISEDDEEELEDFEDFEDFEEYGFEDDDCMDMIPDEPQVERDEEIEASNADNSEPEISQSEPLAASTSEGFKEDEEMLSDEGYAASSQNSPFNYEEGEAEIGHFYGRRQDDEDHGYPDIGVDEEELRSFIMCCYFVIASMPEKPLELIAEHIQMFTGVHIEAQIEKFGGYPSLETFLDDEMCSSLFTKEVIDNMVTYIATPASQFSYLQNAMMHRMKWENSKKTDEQREEERVKRIEAKENKIKRLKNRFEFLKLVQYMQGSDDFKQPIKVQDVVNRAKSLACMPEEDEKLRFGKKYWNANFGRSNATGTFASFFSRDLFWDSTQKGLQIHFQRPFSECKREIVRELKKEGVDTTDIEAEVERKRDPTLDLLEAAFFAPSKLDDAPKRRVTKDEESKQVGNSGKPEEPVKNGGGITAKERKMLMKRISEDKKLRVSWRSIKGDPVESEKFLNQNLVLLNQMR
ncbi:hypothetical protein L596_014483 [Steinernema carpocapsae]|uniref:Uncharacterized protein n=1 Tax=Steinernema carpocapsae TaxID=34508 RepID=A0A4U5NCZ1_STECR|nr:hypothetical protein L596_014483 [Steinernema carpocapsae]